MTNQCETYTHLFDELNARRKKDSIIGVCDPSRECTHPFNPDPLSIFSGFAHRMVDGATIIRPTNQGVQTYRWLLEHNVTSFARDVLLKPEHIGNLMDKIVEEDGCRMDHICDFFPETEPMYVIGTCLWLSKYGMAKLELGDSLQEHCRSVS